MNAHFDKNDKSIFWINFRPIVTPVILHFNANFLMQWLDMPSEWFLPWKKTHSPTLYARLQVCVFSVPCRSTWKLKCSLLIVTNVRQIKPFFVRFCMFLLSGGYRCMYVTSEKILVWLTNVIVAVLMFSKKVYGRDGGHMSKHFARNRIVVQNNSLTCTVSFTLNQVGLSCYHFSI